MSNVILHKNAEGALLETRTIESLDIHKAARQAVAAGKPYKIVDESEIPTNHEFRNSWTIDDAELTDGFGNESNKYE